MDGESPTIMDFVIHGILNQCNDLSMSNGDIEWESDIFHTPFNLPLNQNNTIIILQWEFNGRLNGTMEENGDLYGLVGWGMAHFMGGKRWVLNICFTTSNIALRRLKKQEHDGWTWWLGMDEVNLGRRLKHLNHISTGVSVWHWAKWNR